MSTAVEYRYARRSTALSGPLVPIFHLYKVKVPAYSDQNGLGPLVHVDLIFFYLLRLSVCVSVGVVLLLRGLLRGLFGGLLGGLLGSLLGGGGGTGNW